MAETLSEIRKRAWRTRREKYGLRGNAGSYRRPCTYCLKCERMIGEIIVLHVKGDLSEGQTARATGLDRISVRKLADDLVNSGDQPHDH